MGMIHTCRHGSQLESSRVAGLTNAFRQKPGHARGSQHYLSGKEDVELKIMYHPQCCVDAYELFPRNQLGVVYYL